MGTGMAAGFPDGKRSVSDRKGIVALGRLTLAFPVRIDPRMSRNGNPGLNGVVDECRFAPSVQAIAHICL